MPAPALRGHEVWTPLESFDHVENISAVIDRKLEALRRHRSQLADIRDDLAAQGLNRYRGVLAGHCEDAEVFRTLGAAPPQRHKHGLG